MPEMTKAELDAEIRRLQGFGLRFKTENCKGLYLIHVWHGIQLVASGKGRDYGQLLRKIVNQCLIWEAIEFGGPLPERIMQ